MAIPASCKRQKTPASAGRRSAEFGGIIYLMKERSGHVLVPSADDPNQWDVTSSGEFHKMERNRGRTVRAARRRCVHELHVLCAPQWRLHLRRRPALPNLERNPVTWSQINWAYQHRIWVSIDDETREIRIGVPYAQSTVPNIVLKCNYEELPSFNPPSFAPPIHFSPYIGREIAAGSAYKWSIDDIAANVCIRAERTLQFPRADSRQVRSADNAIANPFRLLEPRWCQ
jgi:hypothetical protein